VTAASRLARGGEWRPWHQPPTWLLGLLVLALALSACSVPLLPGQPPAGDSSSPRDSARRLGQVIPLPASVSPGEGVFTLRPDQEIAVEPATPELLALGHDLAGRIGRASGYGVSVLAGASEPARGGVLLTTAGADPSLGDEGYELRITPWNVTLSAHQPAGIFRGLQTIRQLLPPAVERDSAQPGIWELPAATIRDVPRFGWRGAMLDVARHFFGPEEVKRFIDLMAYYKLNTLHLHLSDDQGWRIEIRSWPNLTTIGGSTEVGGGPGGFYTQAEYAEIVAYAQSRYITVVPEIDMPGHTGAALASYPELNCDGVAPSLYTGVRVGFSALCVESEATYRFVEDVVRELAAITPGPYIHIGGDEAERLSTEAYARFVERAQAIVLAHGKLPIGWEEAAQAELAPGAVVQHWKTELAAEGVRQGAKVIMSPSSRAYLDMKYNLLSPTGLIWAGLIEVEHAYRWDPATQLAGVAEGDILGVEAPLWTETVETREQLDYMAFPRLIGHAEIGWSPAEGRSWEEYRGRLATHGPRLAAMGVAFYRSPQVPWE
jgi:hexosaminidase